MASIVLIGLCTKLTCICVASIDGVAMLGLMHDHEAKAHLASNRIASQSGYPGEALPSKTIGVSWSMLSHGDQSQIHSSVAAIFFDS